MKFIAIYDKKRKKMFMHALNVTIDLYVSIKGGNFNVVFGHLCKKFEAKLTLDVNRMNLVRKYYETDVFHKMEEMLLCHLYMRMDRFMKSKERVLHTDELQKDMSYFVNQCVNEVFVKYDAAEKGSDLRAKKNKEAKVMQS